MSRFLLIFTISIAIGINVIVWIEEFKKGKIIIGIIDIFSTYFLVKIAGGGTYFTSAALFASLAISWYLNNKLNLKFPLNKIENIFKKH